MLPLKLTLLTSTPSNTPSKVTSANVLPDNDLFCNVWGFIIAPFEPLKLFFLHFTPSNEPVNSTPSKKQFSIVLSFIT